MPGTNLNWCVSALALMISLNACASIAEGSTQPVFISTSPVEGASCTLTNGRGEWKLITPDTVVVKKSTTVLKINCSKQGWKDSVAYLAPVQSATALAGTLAFSLIETAVDASTGAGNNYPTSYTIVLLPS